MGDNNFSSCMPLNLQQCTVMSFHEKLFRATVLIWSPNRPEMIEISRKTIKDLIFFTIIMFRNVWQYNVIFQSNDLFQRQISCQKIFLSLDKNS